MNMKTYDTRTRVYRAYLRIKRLVVAGMDKAGAMMRRYTRKGRHHQRRDVKQYRTVAGKRISYYLNPSLRQRWAALRKNRVIAPVAHGWHEPTGAYVTLSDTFVGELMTMQQRPVLSPHAATAVIPRYRTDEPHTVVLEALRGRNDARLLLSGAEGPLSR